MSERIKKVNEFLRHEVAGALESLSLRDFTTVKAVETTKDMKQATVWISVMGDEDEAFSEIEGAKKEIQAEVNKKMQTKNVPRLFFKIDHTAEHAQKIEELLKNESS